MCVYIYIYTYIQVLMGNQPDMVDFPLPRMLDYLRVTIAFWGYPISRQALTRGRAQQSKVYLNCWGMGQIVGYGLIVFVFGTESLNHPLSILVASEICEICDLLWPFAASQ